MKKNKFLIFAILLVLLTIVLCNINEEFYYKILNKSGESYRLNSKGNFDGRCRIYKKGIKIFDGYFKNGKMEGWVIKYYDSGECESKAFYKRDVVDGYKYEYYSNGKLKVKTFMINGNWYAEQLFYSEKGRPTAYWVGDHRNMSNDFFYIKYNSSGHIKQIVGTLLSEKLAIRQKNGFEVIEQGNSYKKIEDLYITVANPPKLKSTFKILVNNKEFNFFDVKSNTLKLTGALKKPGRYVVIGVGTLEDSGKLIKRDSISVTFVKGA